MTRSAVKFAVVTFACIAGLVGVLRADRADDGGAAMRVLLLSVDGLHAGDLDQFVATHPNSALAWLGAHGRTYTHATATKPSDSFPGLLAMVTGGTPRSTGVYYDDGYDRTLAAATGACVGGAEMMWKQNLDVLPFSLTTPMINPLKLPRDPADGCTSRVWPHQFPRMNNVFELVKAAGGRTAWSDKHPAYEFLNGPSGTGIDDLYTPEIQTPYTTLVTTPPTTVSTRTNSFALTMAYDDLKVAAILNEINGFDHTGLVPASVPTVFGMNFQAVSVGQKLKVEQLPRIPPSELCPLCSSDDPLVGGYVKNPDGTFTPSSGLQATLDHTDQSIGLMVAALDQQGLLDSTVIIVTAKHGNSPIDPSTLVRIDPSTLVRVDPLIPASIADIVQSVQPGLLGQLSADTGPLIWLKDSSRTADVVAALKAADPKITGIDPNAPGEGVLWGADLAALYADPQSDSRVPDIILFPAAGTVYTTSKTKIADHGSFRDDDVHVALLVSCMLGQPKTIDDPVETRQIACTILQTLGLDCGGLQSEQIEPSKFLPNSNHKNPDAGRDSSTEP